jgi:hypothetical protein
MTLEKPTRGKPMKEGFLLFKASEKIFFYSRKLISQQNLQRLVS